MATLKMLGKDFINLVCEALGVSSPNVHTIRITADCRGPVTVEIEQHLDRDEAGKIAAALASAKPVIISHHVDAFPIDMAAINAGLEQARRKMMAFANNATPSTDAVPEERDINQECHDAQQFEYFEEIAKFNAAEKAKAPCDCGGVNGAHNFPCPQWKAE